MWALTAVALAAGCPDQDPVTLCTCEQQRTASVQQAIAGAASTAARRVTDTLWPPMVEATCAWAVGAGSAGADRCVRSTRCVRMHAEDRLLTVASTTAPARAIDLARTTGRVSCKAGASATCAEAARATEDQRLAVVVDALRRSQLFPTEPHRLWVSYRDAYCEEEAVLAGVDAAWLRGACSAVLAARRGQQLAALVTDPQLAAELSAARWTELRARVRPWEPWFRALGSPLFVDDALREAAEARSDGAVFPPLVGLGATLSDCGELHPRGSSVLPTPPVASCAASVRKATSAARSVVVAQVTPGPILLNAEEDWREAWCANLGAVDADWCQAEIDWVVNLALAP